MADELIRPVDPDSARAIEASAKLGGKLVDAGTGLGTYLDRVLGRLPDNVVGFLGDWVEEKRIRRRAKLREETEEILRRRGVKNLEDISVSIAVPLIEAAVDEDREALKDMWARLLAAALDPKRTNLVRKSLIETVKRMDPMDALVIQALGDAANPPQSSTLRDNLAKELGVTPDEIAVSFRNLFDLGCTIDPAEPNARLIEKGRLLLRVVND